MTAVRRIFMAIMLLLAVLVAVPPAPAANAAPGDDCAAFVTLLRRSDARAGVRPVPVVFVHGINTDAEHALWPPPDPARPQQSWLRGAVEGIGRSNPTLPIAVDTYAFDYHADSLKKWVDDDNLGPRLARGLMCLARAYGLSVIVVAHSMGGLVAKYAAGQSDGAGGKVGDHLSEVITIGTPFEGSALLTLVQVGSLSPPSPGLEALLSLCLMLRQGQLDDPRPRTSDLCTDPAVLRSAVGSALVWPSDRIKALSDWPGRLRVPTIAGDIQTAPRVFDWPIPGSEVGDAVVLMQSAQAGGHEDQPTTVTCYEVAPNALASACSHEKLPNHPVVINDVVSEVTLAAGAALSADRPAGEVDWRNARYTTTCGGVAEHALAVDVRDGQGQAGPPGSGGYDTYDIKVTGIALGDLTGDGRPEAAVLLWCHPKPSNYFRTEVQVFTDGPRQLNDALRPPDLGSKPLGPEFDGNPFNIEGGRLLAGAGYYVSGDSHASGPSLHRVLAWQWNASTQRFDVQTVSSSPSSPAPPSALTSEIQFVGDGTPLATVNVTRATAVPVDINLSRVRELVISAIKTVGQCAVPRPRTECSATRRSLEAQPAQLPHGSWEAHDDFLCELWERAARSRSILW